MSKDDEKQNMGLTYDIASLYEKGYSMTRMKKEMKLHQETIKRGLRKALRYFCEHYEPSKEEVETSCNMREKAIITTQ